MATYYWVGGNGNWGPSETTNWASSSGGAGGAGFPTPYDDVVFDANSNTGTAAFAVTVTGVAAAPSNCANFNASAVDGVMTLTMGSAARLFCYGNWVNPASNFAYSVTGGAQLNFKATSLGKTISTNNVAMGAIGFVIDGVGGGWTLTTALNLTDQITQNNGSFDTGNQTVAASVISSSNTNTRSLILGSSTLNLSGTAPWNTATTTGLTFSAGTSTIVCSSASSLTFAGGGLTYNNVSFTDATGITFTITITGANTYNNLTFTSPSVPGVKFVAFQTTQTVNGTLTFGSGGTASNRLAIVSTVANTQRTISAATLAAMADVDFRDIVAAGAAAPFTGTRICNAGNNSNITFTAAKTVYWSLVGGGNWSDTVWATSSGGTPAANNFPLAQDTAIIDATGLNNASTVTINQNYWSMPALNVTKTGAFTIAVGNISPTFYGDVTLQAAVTTTGGTGYWTLANVGTTTTLTTNGATISTSGVAISSLGGTVQLGSALTTTGNIIVLNGTFSTANYAVSAAALQSTNTNTRTVSLGSSTVTLTGATPIDFSTTTGLTLTPGTSTIVCSNIAPTFSGNGLTYYNVSFTAGGASVLLITGANTYNNLTFTSPTVAGYRTVSVGANQTINGTINFGTGGTATNRVRFSSNVTNTTRTITAVALATMSDVDFSDITAAGASGTWSGTRIGNIGRNSNITFTAAKTVYWNLAGAQNWNATAWATSSGGTPAVANFPLPQDTAVFDNTGSVTGTITFDTNYFIGSINVTKTGAMTLAVGTTTQIVTGNLTFQAATTITATTGSFSMFASGTQVVTANGATCAALLALNNYAGGTTQLGSNFTTTGGSNIVHTIGTFDLNNFNLTANGISSTTTNTRAILLGSGTHTFSGTTAWDASTTTGLTLTRGTSTIVCSGSAPTFAGGGLTYYNVSFTSSAVGTVAITGANTYNNLTFTSPATAVYKIISFASSQTVGATLTFGAGGTATNRLLPVSSTQGTQVTITAATLAAMSDVDFRDIAAAGAAAPFTGTRIGNLGNNSSITFTAAKTVYWSLAAGGTWQTSTAWATSSGGAPAIVNFPLAQDTAIIDDAGITTGNTINVTAGANIGTLNVTKTAAVTLSFGANNSNFAGNVTLQAATVITGTNNWGFYSSSGTQVLTTNGSVLPVNLVLSGGNLQLGTAVTTTGGLTLTTGALDLNNKTLTAATFTNNNSTTRSIAFGSTGNITVTGNNGTVVVMATMTGFSFTGTSAINLTYSGSTGTRTITQGNTAGSTESNVMNFNVTAGGDIVSFTTTGQIKSLNLTGFAGAFSSTNKQYFGNFTVPVTVAMSGGGTSTFGATSGTQVITTNGVVQDYNVVFGGTATYQLAGNFTVGGGALTSTTTTFTQGTIDLNGYVLSTNSFSSSNSNTRAIAFNSGSITITGNNATVFNLPNSTGFSFTGTSSVNLTYSGAVGTRAVVFGSTGAPTESQVLNFNITAGTDALNLAGNFYAKNVNLTGFAGGYTNQTRFIYGNFTMPAGVTVTGGSAVTTFSATSGTQVITTNGVTQDYPITFNGAAATIYQFADALTQGSTRAFTISSGIIKFKASTTNVVGSFVTSGTTQKYLQSDTAGTQATISQASGIVNASYLTLQDNNATGGATFNAFTDSGSSASNNNIIDTNVTGWNRIPSGSGFLMFF